MAEPEHNCRRQYLPGVWGEFFITHQPCTPEELLSMKEKASAKKVEVRQIVLESASMDLARKLNLVDVLQRLGVDYHFQEEIDELLRSVFYDKDGGSNDLCLTSLRESSHDVNILIMLYDAGHMRIRSEEILDHIVTVNKSRLQSLLKTDLEPSLAEEMRVTLETRFRRVQRVEARRFISVYEKNDMRDETILEFARMNFNIMQVAYAKESKELSM
ncbi:hypothetical protein HU200_039950 [Digitaria exilis]|uniref:Terpene synthase N-terminal domain-containing protein n=1 Tax=Digitaria exilis TaxID=1010633 RepID=A0A835EGZ3_9POAL|nr:hypothetical protein HU200_039950 [Digitaria exilis]